MNTDKPLVVRDLKAFLDTLPDDMPLFRSDHDVSCEPVTSEGLPTVETVLELEFSHGRFYHIGPRNHLVDHEVLRQFPALDMG